MVGGGLNWSDSTLNGVHRVRTLDELGEQLRRLRRRHARRQDAAELTVRELARRTGYAYGVISEYLNGKALPPTDRFDVLVRLLGADPTEQRALATARDRVEERRRARRAVGPVPRELPPDVYGFTGRARELAQLDQLLDRAGDGPGVGLVSAVAGTAGVGKTALAVRWAHLVAEQFPDGCLYVDLRGYDPDRPVRPADALAGFLRSLGVPGPELPYDEAERAARYRTLLAGRRMLILLDNARHTDHVRQLLPGGRDCVVVVTSRDALTGLVARHGAHRVRLQAMSQPEAAELLDVLIGDRVRAEPAAAAALAERCVRLPLALRLAAELAAARPAATLAELDTELADIQHRLDRLDAGGEPRTASRAVFSWSYQHLGAATARAFRLLGGYPGRDIDAYGLAALAGTDLGRAGALLAQLAQAHLVQPAGPDRYGMHDLLRAYAAELAAADRETERHAALVRVAGHQLHACSVAMAQVAPFDRGRPQVPDPGWPVPALAGEASAVAWLDVERPNLVAVAVHAAANGWADADHAGRLGAVLVRYLDVGAHYQDAELLYRGAIAGGTASTRANASTSLGIVCWRLGRYEEAADHLETALATARRIGDQVEIGRALIGLGIVYWQLGRVTDTLHAGEQAVELYRAAGDRTGQAKVLGNLGIVHRHLGDHRVAVEHHQRALELFREVGDPAALGNELCSLGALYQGLGDHDRALDLLREALDLAGRTGYRETEALATGAIGTVYRQLGRFADAEDHHQRSLDMLRQIGDRASEGFALGDLGALYRRMGRYTEAVAQHEHGLRIADELGDEHLAAQLFNRLGDAVCGDARPAEALEHHRRALAITGRTGNRYEQAHAHHGIARALTATGDAGAARPHWVRARALYAELGVPELDEVRTELEQPR